MMSLAILGVSCSDDECGYEVTQSIDCPSLGLNIGDACSVNGDGVSNGTVNEFCECIPDFTLISECPGFFQNGDFEITTGDPNTVIDNDIDLATGWGPLWQSGSLADLFDDTTTNYGGGCFVGPTPQSGVFAGMWVENNSNADASATFREGFFNQLNAVISPNTGTYTLSFDYANMSQPCATSNDIKVGVYGVNYDTSTPLPANPTGVGAPSNLDLFGSSNTVYLGEITITSGTTNVYTSVSFSLDTNTLPMPAAGFNHIMISNSHLPFEDFGRMFVGFDNFCLIN